MDALMLLIPLSLILGLGALALFLWALRSGQFEDLDAAARRILFDDDPPRGTRSPPPSPRKEDQP